MKNWSRMVARSPWIWIIGWLLGAAITGFGAPEIASLLEDDRHGFLPSNMPSQTAAARLRQEFPDAAYASRAVVVCVRPQGLTDSDRDFIHRVARELRNRSSALGWRVRATDESPYLKQLLESADGQAALMVVELPAGSLTKHSVNRVHEIERILADARAPEGLEIVVTGSAAMGALLNASAKRDVDMTTIWAIAAVAIILLLVYRSPVAVLLPLFTIAIALVISLGLIGWAAQAGWPLNGLVQMFVIVIVVGTGTDYCLFLFARFREEAAVGGDFGSATMAAMSHAGPAILASAGTNAAGLATLTLARNRDLYTSGPTIALAIAVTALAVLTLTPALIRVFGSRLVRVPASGGSQNGDGRLWQAAAKLVTTRPALVAAVVTAVLVGAAAIGAAKRTHPVYDSLEQFPADSSFVRGAKLYSDHFFAGRAVAEATLVISSDASLETIGQSNAFRAALDGLANRLRDGFPVVYYRDLFDPFGNSRTGMSGDVDTVGNSFSRSVVERFARPIYLGSSERTARIELGLAVEPRSIAAMKMVEELRDVAESALRSELAATMDAEPIEVLAAGETSVYADMRGLRQRDFRVIGIAAIALIGVILVWMIRSVAQAAVLIAATLLTYLATYGITWMIVREVFGQPALAWQIDFLLFIVVLSLGQDYNIFVVARIREELTSRPPREAISLAIRKTGRVVSSCGLIMAATFASMFAGSLLVMKQFALALSLAMLIDTFVVRPLLVPAAILLLLERRRHKQALAKPTGS